MSTVIKVKPQTFTGKIVDVKDDFSNPENTVLIVEKHDGSLHEVVVTPFQVRRLMQEADA